MLIHLKLPKALYDIMLQDLERPNAHAYERVGFLFVKKGTVDADTLILLAAEYNGVRDQDYINAPDVGAKINSAAIRSAMERAMNCGYGIIHVHFHGEVYSSRFSKTDRLEFARLIHSFHNIGGHAAHGALVFCGERFTGLILLKKDGPVLDVSKLTVTGYPMKEYLQERSRLW